MFDLNIALGWHHGCGFYDVLRIYVFVFCSFKLVFCILE